MKSLRELFRIGPGPSSSHTMGPQRAVLTFMERTPQADHYQAVLYGSLALTGKGHLTDAIIEKTFAPKPCTIVMDVQKTMKHPNTMRLIAYDNQGAVLSELTVYSIGGGAPSLEVSTMNF